MQQRVLPPAWLANWKYESHKLNNDKDLDAVPNSPTPFDSRRGGGEMSETNRNQDVEEELPCVAS